jgi:hypothetical protein
MQFQVNSDGFQREMLEKGSRSKIVLLLEKVKILISKRSWLFWLMDFILFGGSKI